MMRVDGLTYLGLQLVSMKMKIPVHLGAMVTMPSITQSMHFGSIKCGLCKVVTIQLQNHQQVPCKWALSKPEKPKMDKHAPLHVKQRIWQEYQNTPQIFKMLPTAGVLQPGEKANVQVKFSPTEEKMYSQRLVLCIAHSTQRVTILAQGQGKEPRLEFSSSLLKLGPVLPHSAGGEAEVVVRNPCAFPIEFYCLEFDQQYLEEEKILQMMEGYDSENVLLLPPRDPGEKLPPELLEYYEEQRGAQEESSRLEEEPSTEGAERESSAGVGKPEVSPVSRAVARHMGIDLSLEGQAALNCRGIAIIVHGAPLTGKTGTSVTLAKHYGAACLSIDAVVLEAVSSGSSEASLQARELCDRAAEEQTQSPDDGLPVSCVLPDELLVDILSERLQLSDCHRGVVFDGLETLYSHSLSSALQALLKAFNNRQYIYLVDLNQDYRALKAREQAQMDEEERLRKESLKRDLAWMQEMDQEEYDALSKEERERSDLWCLEERRKRKRRKQDKWAPKEEKKMQKVKQEKKREEGERRKKSHVGGKQHKEHPETHPRAVTHNHEDDKNAKVDISPTPVPEQLEEEQVSEAEKLLQLRFHQYKQSQAAVAQILLYWDHVQGQVVQDVTAKETHPEAQEVAVRPEKRVRRKNKEKERLEQEKFELMLSPAPSQTVAMDEEELLEGRGEVGVPHISLQVSGREHPSGAEILHGEQLPCLNEVLDGMGLGPSGPPIPPPTIFSVVPYPKTRRPPSSQESLGHFTLIAPRAEDAVEDGKDTEPDLDTLTTIKEDLVMPTKARGKKEKLETEGWESQKDKSRGPGGKKGIGSSGPLPPVTESQQDKRKWLTHYRWVAPPNGEVSLKVCFTSSKPGQFEQTYNFELMGTRRCYQLNCRGVCAFPAISKDPKVVLSQCKKALNEDYTLNKTYIRRSGVFQFGPLFYGKTRDRYKEKKYTENMEKLIVYNISPLDAEVVFCFQKATSFLLDPPTMTLRPDEKQELTVWAYPTSPGLFEDSVVCCVKDNPDPVLFRVSCHGARPELDLDCTQLKFKTPLHRKVTKSLSLRNRTLLPGAWRLSDLEILGGEVTVSQDQGIIQPQAEISLQMHFRAKRPLNLKRIIRLEVSDVEKTLGVLHSENIQVSLEAYDVSLDLSLSKGAADGLDFGTIKVSDEVVLSVHLKNKGRYEIAFKFLLEATQPGMPNLSPLFTITPSEGSLNPNDRATVVHIAFRSSREVCIQDQPILNCQVIDPNITEGGETIASIPVKISVQSLFTKYCIVPANDLNFGAIVCGTGTRRTFTIENKGKLGFRYNIFSMPRDEPQQTQSKGSVAAKQTRVSCSGKPVSVHKLGPSESMQREKDISAQACPAPGPPQATVTVGVFTVSPGFGRLAHDAQQVITVECLANQEGKYEEFLGIDISDRDPRDQPNGISYRLEAEGCLTGANVNDVASIIEEPPVTTVASSKVSQRTTRGSTSKTSSCSTTSRCASKPGRASKSSATAKCPAT
ncbi:hydrocephalus-inducing protein-like isoform X2 [Amia ocellicauda]|uniref:hydrocephalus-inducing protein-like isoform X2 n=1 Tax=Amia ocellicauda TaxID=2972642 RepID=UPI0034640910